MAERRAPHETSDQYLVRSDSGKAVYYPAADLESTVDQPGVDLTLDRRLIRDVLGRNVLPMHRFSFNARRRSTD